MDHRDEMWGHESAGPELEATGLCQGREPRTDNEHGLGLHTAMGDAPGHILNLLTSTFLKWG